MKKIGITGGIGSGKTTVCTLWEQEGAKVVYADELAKKLMVEDPELVSAIKETFGEQAYLENGQLNKVYLAEEAFEKGRVEDLNKLVHPRVYKKTDELVRHAQKDGFPVFVKEAALLLKNGRPDNLDFIVMVMANEDLRIDRVKSRDKSSSEEVESRIKNQQNFTLLKPHADYIIKNDGSLEDLKLKAIRIYRSFLS